VITSVRPMPAIAILRKDIFVSSRIMAYTLKSRRWFGKFQIKYDHWSLL
jgi:hypothetical protein